MTLGSRLIEGSMHRRRLVTWATAAVTLLIAALAVLPSLFPGALPLLHTITVDTDPENMLAADEPVRRFHHEMKERFGLYDMVVVGVVNDEHPEGVFNPQSLRKIHELTLFAETLRGETLAPGLDEDEGVIVRDLMAPSTVDSVEPAPGNMIRMEWLMAAPPATQAEALAIRDRALRIPFLRDTIVSGDGKAVALYLPLTRKDLSYRVYDRLKGKIAQLGGPEQFHVTGLPVAEDTFGVEMFLQMAISAPAAMAVIFVLMMLFFRKVLLVVSSMLVAMISVIFTMGALVIAGFPVHIMSSMIPIFIMPIAVLDSIHIISEFFEKYPQFRDKRQTIREVMNDLFSPMLYTSLTSAAGFASLALTPIPPVQVFGVFVAMGILVAWVLTVTFLPAFLTFLPERSLANFGAKGHAEGESHGPLSRFLQAMGRGTYRWAKPIVAAAVLVLVLAGWGMSKIVVNDNPVKWFTPTHPIRVADRVLNEHFGGTYMAYLALEAEPTPYAPDVLADRIATAAKTRRESLNDLAARMGEAARTAASDANTPLQILDAARQQVRPDVLSATDEQLSAYSAMQDFLQLEELALTYASPTTTESYAEQFARSAREFAVEVGDRLQRVGEHAYEIVKANPPTREAFFSRLETGTNPNAPRLLVTTERSGYGRPGGDAGSPVDPPASETQSPPSSDGPSLPPGLEESGSDSGPSLPAGLSADGGAGGPSLPPGLDAGSAEEPSPLPDTEAPNLRERTLRGLVELFLDEQRSEGEYFKDPAYLARIEQLQETLATAGAVGKSNSLVDIVKTVNRDLHGGDPNFMVIPPNRQAVAQAIDQFRSGHDRVKDDVYHFVSPDYHSANIWVQLRSGDNRDMESVVRTVAAGPGTDLPVRSDWFGLTYINVVWQEKMVTGMLEAFAGSFLVVFLLMTVLFRSALWGLLSMIPLTVTITAIYGAIGIVGKDYDMPVAVLSSLTLGLAVDFAIHFLARGRTMYAASGSWKETAPNVFGEPARAISRNIIVIAAGFLPLLLAPLVPYQTVGMLLATILLVSGVGTLLLLPALVRLLERRLFPQREEHRLACRCGTCAVAAMTAAALGVLSVRQYTSLGWNGLVLLAGGIVAGGVAACWLLSRRSRCALPAENGKNPEANAQENHHAVR